MDEIDSFRCHAGGWRRFDVKGTETEAGIAVRLEDTALRDKLNGAINAIVADGTYKKIQAKYFDFDIY